MSDKLNNTLGQQLRCARAVKEWSLDAASKATGVSKAMLGQIERGESSPTVAKLWKIATGFELPLSYFFNQEGAVTEQVQGLKREQGISIATLFSFDSDTQLEVFSLTLSPGHQQQSSPHSDGVIEHISVISGDMECLIDGQWLPLSEGQQLKFNANKAHGYRNVSANDVTFHNIISYRDGK